MIERDSSGDPAKGDASDGEYQVGYGRPPRDHRFKPGQSGNPKGRPRGSKSFSTHLQEELAELVSLNENGKSRRMSKKQVLAKQLVNKALAIHAKATGLVLDQITRVEGPPDQQPSSRMLAPKDEAAAQNLLRRLRLFDASPPGGSDKEDEQ